MNELDAVPPFKLLYSTICEHAPAVEHEEIKRVLGRDTVEGNEMLLAEYNALLDISGAFEQETHAMHEKQQEAHRFLVPDRDRHLRNIKFFIENISRAATPSTSRRPHTGPLPLASNPQEQAVLDFVSGGDAQAHSCRAPGSPGVTMAGTLRPGTARSVAVCTPRPLTAPAPEQSAAARKVRALDMDETKKELREMLQREKETLLQQVELLRLSLEDAAEHRHDLLDAPLPSVKDMKDFEQKLERLSVEQESLVDIMERTVLSPTPPTVGRAANSRAAQCPKSPAPMAEISNSKPVCVPLTREPVMSRVKKTKAMSIDCSGPGTRAS